MPVSARVTIEGMDDVRLAFRKLGGPELVKQLGQVHKSIGALIISKAGGAETGVGEGAGSTIRPSATTASVYLRVGGAWRAGLGRWRQWGVRQIWPPPGRRPFIIGAALSAEDEIDKLYLAGIAAVVAPEGLKVEVT